MATIGESRQCELRKSKILLRHWSYTWQKKTTKKKQNSDPQPIQSFSMPRYTEKTGRLLHSQMLAPNLLGTQRPTVFVLFTVCPPSLPVDFFGSLLIFSLSFSVSLVLLL
jgi:hypothetical protein